MKSITYFRDSKKLIIDSILLFCLAFLFSMLLPAVSYAQAEFRDIKVWYYDLETMNVIVRINDGDDIKFDIDYSPSEQVIQKQVIDYLSENHAWLQVDPVFVGSKTQVRSGILTGVNVFFDYTLDSTVAQQVFSDGRTEDHDLRGTNQDEVRSIIASFSGLSVDDIDERLDLSFTERSTKEIPFTSITKITIRVGGVLSDAGYVNVNFVSSAGEVRGYSRLHTPGHNSKDYADIIWKDLADQPQIIGDFSVADVMNLIDSDVDFETFESANRSCQQFPLIEPDTTEVMVERIATKDGSYVDQVTIAYFVDCELIYNTSLAQSVPNWKEEVVREATLNINEQLAGQSVFSYEQVSDMTTFNGYEAAGTANVAGLRQKLQQLITVLLQLLQLKNAS